MFDHHLTFQHDVTELSREISRLEAEKKRQAGQLELIVKTYKCCRELFAICVESIKEVETGNIDPLTPSASVPASPGAKSTPSQTPSLKRKFSFSGSHKYSVPIQYTLLLFYPQTNRLRYHPEVPLLTLSHNTHLKVINFILVISINLY